MKPRRALTDALERMAFAAELLGDPRAKTLSQSAWAVRSLEGDIEELVSTGGLLKVRGVDEIVLPIAEAVLRGERPAELAELEARVPAGLFELRRVKGLGAKKIKALFTELSIETLAELEYACRENRLVDLKGFGEKTQATVLDQLEDIRSSAGKMRRDQAWAILDPALAALEASPWVHRAEVVSDHARGLSLVSELAVLVEAEEGADVEALVSRATPAEVEVKVHLADAETFGARSVWLTSAEGHRAALAERAAGSGWVFDERGLTAHGEVLACPEEEDLYGALGLWPTDVERRNDGVPLVRIGRSAPRLIELEDLRGALHNHTVASDGSATLVEMQAAAGALGLEYLGITEHSESAFYARGLTKERLRDQVRAIADRNEQEPSCRLLTGVESDIREHGDLDYEDDVLAQLDVVVASVHRRHGQDEARMTARMVKAASHRFTDVVGHPTGRLLLGRAPSPLDMEAFLDACAANGTAVELNANPARLDLSAAHLAMAKERGVLVSIAADAHSVRELELLEVGVTIARRAGLTAEDVLNARGEDELRSWISNRRAPRRTA